MTKNQKILFDLLQAKGHNVQRIWFYPTFGYQNGGWTATIIEKDDEGFTDEVDYDLGYDFMEAKGQIENNEIKKL